MRGILAILILFSHVAMLSSELVKSEHMDIIFRFSEFIGVAFAIGFIIISGYCINESMKKPVSFTQFWLKRIYRIFPLVIVSTVIAGLLEYVMFGSGFRPTYHNIGISPLNFFYALTGMIGFYGQFGSAAPNWVISYLLLYYLIWSASRWLLKKFLFVVLANICFIVVLIIYNPLLPDILRPIFRPTVLALYGPWIMGAALSHFRDDVVRGRIQSIAGPLSWLAVPVFYMVSWMLYKSNQYSFPWLWIIVFYQMVGLTFVFLIYKYGLEWKLWLDRISFPLYLIHGPVIVFTAFLLNHLSVRIPYAPIFIILSSSAILFSFPVTRFIEEPIQGWRKTIFR